MSRKKLNITDTISEIKQIIDKYGGIPSQQVDKVTIQSPTLVKPKWGTV